MKKIILLILLIPIVIFCSRINIGDLIVERDEIVKGDRIVVGNAVIQGRLEGDITVFGEYLHIKGHVTGDVLFIGETLGLFMDSEVGGTIDFIGRTFIIEEGAEYGTINKKIFFSQFRQFPFRFEENYIARFLNYFLKLLLVLFVYFILSNFTINITKNLVNDPLKSYLFGILYFFTVIFGSIILFITLIGIPLALLIIIFFVFSILVSTTSISLWAGGILVKQLPNYIKIVIGYTMIHLLGLIPVVKIILTLTITTAFMGSFFLMLFKGRFHKT